MVSKYTLVMGGQGDIPAQEIIAQKLGAHSFHVSPCRSKKHDSASKRGRGNGGILKNGAEDENKSLP